MQAVSWSIRITPITVVLGHTGKMKTFTSVLLLATAAIVVNTADAALPSFRGFAISGTLYGTAPNVSLETGEYTLGGGR